MTPDDLKTRLLGLADPGVFAREFLAMVPTGEQDRCLAILLEDEHEQIVLAPREELFRMHDEEGQVYLALSGSLDEWRGQIRIATRRPGDLVGELPALQQEWPEQGLTATAREPTQVLAINPRAFTRVVDASHGFARAVLRAVAEHAADAVDDERQFPEALDQYFPKGRGRLTPGPYDCHGAVLHLFFCKDGDPTVDEVDEAMPPGIKRLPAAPPYMLGVAQMGTICHPEIDRQSFTYDEVMAFVPVRVDGHVRPRFHVPFMFPDNIMAIYLGREIAGLPKLRASTFVDRIDDEVTRLLMRRLGRTELEIRFREVEAEPRRPGKRAPRSLRQAWETVVSADARSGAGIRAAERAAMWAVRRMQRQLPWSPRVKPRMPTTAWKRVFDPSTPYHGPRRWRRGDFEVDALVETPFQVETIHDIRVLELTEPIWFHEEFPVGQSVSISDFGLKVVMDMRMMAGRTLIDYRTAKKYRKSRRLDWDPG